MGRKRKTNKDLPNRWTRKHGRYYYIVPPRFAHLFTKTWLPLGRTLPDAYREFSMLPIHEEVNVNEIRTINDLADLYEREIYPTNALMTKKNKQSYMPSIRVGLGEMLIDAVEEHHARKLHKALLPLRGVKTSKEVVGLLRHMLSVAKEHGIIRENRLLGMRIKGNKPRRRLVAYSELREFIENYAHPLLVVYVPLKVITAMDKQMMLAATVHHITDEGFETTRRKNDSLPKVYRWDEDGQLKTAINNILEYKRKQKIHSIYLFCNREGQPYLPIENGQMFDLEGRAFGKPEGFNSLWQRGMKKWVRDGHERFTEHDLRKVPASATDTIHAQQLLDHHSQKMTKEVYQVGTRVVDIQPDPGEK